MSISNIDPKNSLINVHYTEISDSQISRAIPEGLKSQLPDIIELKMS